jgi:flagellar biosynthesis/type III secretory pathway M-ring protein FliF/YscJ
MSLKGPIQVEALLILIPLFLIFLVVFVALVAVSLQAKRREAEESKALSPETREQQ